jgi:hypothetical protein
MATIEQKAGWSHNQFGPSGEEKYYLTQPGTYADLRYQNSH